MKPLEDRRLNTFLTVAQLGSFSEAAKVLFVTQSTVTTRIQDLERELNSKLFIRHARATELTESGRVFLLYAQRSLRSIKDGRAAVAAVQAGTLGQLRIMASRVPAAFDLPHLLSACGLSRQNFPVHLRTGSSKAVFRSLLQGEVDVGLVNIHFRHPAVATELVVEETVSVVAAGPKAGAGYTAGGAGEFQSAGFSESGEVGSPTLPTQLMAPTGSILFLEEELEDTLRIRSICHQFGWPTEQCMGISDLATLINMLQQGLAIGILPRKVVSEQLAEGSLIEVLDDEAEALPKQITCLLVRRESEVGPLSPLTRRLVESAHRYYAASKQRVARGPTAP